MAEKKKTSPVKKEAEKAVRKTAAKAPAKKKTTPKAAAKKAPTKKKTAIKKAPAKKTAASKAPVKKTAVRKKTAGAKSASEINRVSLASKVSAKLSGKPVPASKAVRKKAASKKAPARKKNKVNLVVRKKTAVRHTPAPEPDYQLPAGYGDNLIYCMIRDPEWIYVYWEIQPEYQNQVLAELGGSLDCVDSILRVYDLTENDAYQSYFDIKLEGLASCWFIRVRPNHQYVVEIGLLHADGRYRVLAKSNVCQVPRDSVSDVIDENWMGLDMAKVYALSGGGTLGMGSKDIAFLIEGLKEHHLSSGSGGSSFRSKKES